MNIKLEKSNITLKRNLDTFTTRELRTIGIGILEVTRKVLGHGNKPIPKFKIRNNLTGHYGLYDYDYTIFINPTNCGTIEKYVQTIIHEYTHHIQRGLKRNYTSSVIRDGYWDSPFEVEARKNEKKYKSVVWKEVKKTF
jgi:hypothetical protein